MASKVGVPLSRFKTKAKTMAKTAASKTASKSVVLFKKVSSTRAANKSVALFKKVAAKVIKKKPDPVWWVIGESTLVPFCCVFGLVKGYNVRMYFFATRRRKLRPID